MRGVVNGTASEAINTGNEYIMREQVADWGANQGNAKGELYVYDADLNPLKSHEFDRPVVRMSYVDGVCYVVLFNPYVLMKSTDFENWEVIGENLGVPISLGDRTIMRTYERQKRDISAAYFYAKQDPMLFIDG